LRFHDLPVMFGWSLTSAKPPQRLMTTLESAVSGAARKLHWMCATELAELILPIFRGPTTEEILKSLSESCGRDKPHL